MKKYQIYIVLTLFFCFLLFLQESFLSKITIFGFSFNLYLILLFLLIFFCKGNLGFISAILAGIILDLFSFFPFGVFTLSFTVSAFLTEKISRVFQKSNIFVFFLLFGLFFAFYKILFLFGNFLFSFL